MNKNNTEASVENLIAPKEYYNLKEEEQYDFLLKNAIYIKRNNKPNDDRYLENKDKKECWFLEEYYIVNPIIIKDIISTFLKLPINTSPIKDKIKVAVSNSLDVSDALKKWHKEYSTTISESYINPLEFYDENKINTSKLEKKITKHFKKASCDCINLRIVEQYILITEFELSYIPFYKEMIKVITCMDILHFIKTQVQSELAIKLKSNQKQLTTNQTVILIEKIQHLENWSDYESTKKATIISALTGKSYENTRKAFYLLEKKSSELTPQFKKDIEHIDNLLKNSNIY